MGKECWTFTLIGLFATVPVQPAGVTGIAASGWTEDSQGVCGAAIGKGCSYQRFRISRNIWKLSEQQEFEEKKEVWTHWTQQNGGTSQESGTWSIINYPTNASKATIKHPYGLMVDTSHGKIGGWWIQIPMADHCPKIPRLGAIPKYTRPGYD